jgi:hypothetical protein
MRRRTTSFIDADVRLLCAKNGPSMTNGRQYTHFGLERSAMSPDFARCRTGGHLTHNRGRIYSGDRYSECIYMEEGDFVFAPPFMPHVAVNISTTVDLIWFITRTPENIVVILPGVGQGVSGRSRSELASSLNRSFSKVQISAYGWRSRVSISRRRSSVFRIFP